MNKGPSIFILYFINNKNPINNINIFFLHFEYNEKIVFKCKCKKDEYDVTGSNLRITPYMFVGDKY